MNHWASGHSRVSPKWSQGSSSHRVIGLREGLSQTDRISHRLGLLQTDRDSHGQTGSLTDRASHSEPNAHSFSLFWFFLSFFVKPSISLGFTCLCPTPMEWVVWSYRTLQPCWLFLRILGIQTQILMLTNQAFLPTEPFSQILVLIFNFPSEFYLFLLLVDKNYVSGAFIGK